MYKSEVTSKKKKKKYQDIFLVISVPDKPSLDWA